MRHIQRLIAASVLLALCGVLTGCGGASSFDPMDMLDFLDQKKPLQGARKPVFPEGVPGVEQGVPKELYKGAQAQQQDVPPVTSPPPEPEPKSKRGKKSKSSTPPEPAAAPDADAPAEDAAPATAPAPKPAKRKRTSPTAIPREDAAPAQAPAQQPAAQPQQSQQQQQLSPFPAPMPSGSFSR